MNQRSLIFFVNDDRQHISMYLREHFHQLLASKKKKCEIINPLTKLMLEEESQDLARHKVEVLERQDEREAKQASAPQQKSLPVHEIKRRVRALFGKEPQ